jgi:hypothetical protein
MRTPVGGGATPLIVVQSLPAIRLRSGLRSTIGINRVQSPGGKEDDSAWRRTFFMPSFILVDEAVGEQNARRIEDKGKILRWVRT